VSAHWERHLPEVVVAPAARGRWEVLSVSDQQQIGGASTQLGAIEIALARLREVGGGRLTLQSRSGRIELRTVTANGTLVPL
jgi:hypothetical protein